MSHETTMTPKQVREFLTGDSARMRDDPISADDVLKGALRSHPRLRAVLLGWPIDLPEDAYGIIR